LFVRTQTNGSRTYLLIVDNQWVGGKVKQRVLLRLGRLDELLASGRLDSLIQSLGRFSDKLAVLGAHARGDSITTRSARIGPALIFQRLWQTCSIDKVLTALLQGRRFEFSVERAIFLTVLHRLFAPGSDRAAEKWKDDYAIDGVGGLDLHQLYRAMAWLGEVLPKAQQNGATPFVPLASGKCFVSCMGSNPIPNILSVNYHIDSSILHVDRNGNAANLMPSLAVVV
jgi:hypothetical protein